MDFLDVVIPILPVCGLLILVLILGIAANYFWLQVMYRRIRACPECGAKAAGEVVNTDEIVLANNVDYKGRKPVRLKETKMESEPENVTPGDAGKHGRGRHRDGEGVHGKPHGNSQYRKPAHWFRRSSIDHRQNSAGHTNINPPM